MFDDDDEEGPPSGEPSEERPLTMSAAVMWLLFVFAGTVLLVGLTQALRPSASGDVVNLVGCQAVAYLTGTFLLLRLHAPSRALPVALGFRPTHPGFYVSAALLGVVLQIPAELIQQLIERRWPLSPEETEQLAMIQMHGTLQRMMVPLVVVGLGPLVEEVFFRGALHTGLRKVYGDVSVVLAVAALFAGAHGSLRLFVPMFFVGLVINTLRAASGSVFPTLLLHMVFNGVAIAGLILDPQSATQQVTPLSRPISIGGIACTMALLAAVLIIGKHSTRAQRARQEDQL